MGKPLAPPVGVRWSIEQVLALAPDAAAGAAGRGLARPGPWSATGASVDPPALWGDCQGSGRTPYQAMVDLSGPAFRCSCPSRKFPCKHGLGLLLLWAAGGVPQAALPDGVAGWLAERARRGGGGPRPVTAPDDGGPGQSSAAAASLPGGGALAAAPADPAAAAKRAAQRVSLRAGRMAIGLQELQRWLLDQVRAGLAGRERGGYAEFDTLAARLVDAQLPGVAAAVRRLPGVLASGDGWPSRLLAEYANLHLLAAAHARLAIGPAVDPAVGFADTVRAHLGVPVPVESVLATAGVRDHWTVLGLRDTAEDRLVTRRVWLVGRTTQRLALVLSFAPIGQPLEASLVPGRTLDADLHFYPGALPLRAAVGVRHAQLETPIEPLPGTDLDGALAGWAAGLARDPWLRSWPVVLEAALPVPTSIGWWLRDDRGAALPAVLDPGGDLWDLAAICGGTPMPMLVEVVPSGVRPIAALTDREAP